MYSLLYYLMVWNGIRSIPFIAWIGYVVGKPLKDMLVGRSTSAIRIALIICNISWSAVTTVAVYGTVPLGGGGALVRKSTPVFWRVVAFLSQMRSKSWWAVVKLTAIAHFYTPTLNIFRLWLHELLTDNMCTYFPVYR